MNGLTLEVQGLDALSAKLRGGGAALEVAIDDVVARSALRIQRDAQALAPVDTGRLRASIEAIQQGAQSWTVGVHAGAPASGYAIFQEYGTSRMQAQPFLGPAVAAERPRLAADGQQAIAAVLAR